MEEGTELGPSLQVPPKALEHVPVDEAGPETCVICLGNLSTPCEAKPCGHNNFDYLCLVTWLEFRPTCPLCQSKIYEVHYHSDGGDGPRKLQVYTVPEPSAKSSIEACSRPPPSQPGRVYVPAEDEGLRRRRTIYQQRLYALHVGSNRRQPVESRSKDLSPQLFLTHPELVSRARMWLHRELRVFDFLYTDIADPRNINLSRPSNAEFVREYIIFILKTVDTQDHTGQAENVIQRFIGRENARHLLHELRAWLRSSCKSLEEWDRIVQYRVDALPRASPDTTSPPPSEHRVRKG